MKIAIIGAGNMGGAIARGLAASGRFNAEHIAVSNPSRPKLDALNADYPAIYTTTSNLEVVNDADLIILAVKPWIIKEVVSQIAPRLDYSCQMLMSLAAGVTIDTLKEWVSEYSDSPILFRCMPNTAISVGQSMTFLTAAGASDDEIASVAGIFDTVGRTAVIEERLMGAATAVCSCGIAYAMRYVRAATEGAVELGLRPDAARNYIMQTMAGAVAVLEASGANPETEIDRVTTPGGVTIKGLNAMEAAGFSNAVIKGLINSRS